MARKKSKGCVQGCKGNCRLEELLHEVGEAEPLCVSAGCVCLCMFFSSSIGFFVLIALYFFFFKHSLSSLGIPWRSISSSL